MDRRFGRSREQVSRTSRASAHRAIGSAPAEASRGHLLKESRADATPWLAQNRPRTALLAKSLRFGARATLLHNQCPILMRLRFQGGIPQSKVARYLQEQEHMTDDERTLLNVATVDFATLTKEQEKAIMLIS
jgi:hypothetical protein